MLKGSEVNHIAHLGDGRLVMAGKSAWFGPALQMSDDDGARRGASAGAIRFAEGRGHSVERIWFVKADPRVPGRLYAGVDPGALFVSDDRGGDVARGRRRSPIIRRARTGLPGAGGLMVHSMAFDRLAGRRG